jgi:hypothetical protein
VLAAIQQPSETAGHRPSLVFRAQSLETSPGTFVPALMLERQLSGLFRHCGDVPGDMALGQPVCCLPESCSTAHPAKRIANAAPATNFPGFMVCAFFACAPEPIEERVSGVDRDDINPNLPSTAKLPELWSRTR